MNNQRFFFETILVHLLAWRGIRTLLSQLPEVLARQLSTFGLLQGLGMKYGKPTAVFGLAGYSFPFAHLIGSSLSIVIVAAVMSLLFGALLERTKNLGAGLGIHASFYFMRAIFGWGA